MPFVWRGLAALLGATIAIAVSAAAPVAPVVRQRQLLPTDEAVRHPDFFSFRAGLQAAVARRDLEALLAVVHPAIKNSFGGDDGVEAFRRMWKLDDTAAAAAGPDGTEGIWAELGTVLALGGSFAGDGTFVAPYTFSRWPAEVDAFEHIVLLAANVRVRAAPGLDAPVIRSASFEIFPRAPASDGTDGWVGVRLGPGKVGHVAGALVRSPIDYRAIFSRAAGRWQLVTFVAGD
jgi:hypothetical protein